MTTHESSLVTIFPTALILVTISLMITIMIMIYPTAIILLYCQIQKEANSLQSQHSEPSNCSHSLVYFVHNHLALAVNHYARLVIGGHRSHETVGYSSAARKPPKLRRVLHEIRIYKDRFHYFCKKGGTVVHTMKLFD